MSFDASDFLRKLQIVADRQLEAARDATNEFAEHVFSESQELVPVSPVDRKHPYYTGTSGDLARSGAVKDAVIDGDQIEVEMGYNTDYAAAVHERLDVNHDYEGAPNREKAQAKYLSEPLEKNAPKFAPFVADRMKEAAG